MADRDTPEPIRASDPLTLRQRRFVMEYVKNPNGTQAAINAGYSAKTATVQASRLLTLAKVQAAMRQEIAPMEARLPVEATEVLGECERIAYADITDIVSWDQRGEVTVRHSSEIPQDALAAIKEVRTTKGGALIVKLHDKSSALRRLAQHYRLLGPKRPANDEGSQYGAFLDLVKTGKLDALTAALFGPRDCDAKTKESTSSLP